MYLAAKHTEYAISGLVANMHIKQPIICLYSVASAALPASSFTNLYPGTMGLHTLLQSPIPNLFRISDPYFGWCIDQSLQIFLSWTF
ncbi:hypothetical protein QL285_078555 [Trifolium repens]|nr:hypothetical protein QL285_078555 [Trifolium repens]